jgi:hypothetical protein
MTNTSGATLARMESVQTETRDYVSELRSILQAMGVTYEEVHNEVKSIMENYNSMNLRQNTQEDVLRNVTTNLHEANGGLDLLAANLATLSTDTTAFVGSASSTLNEIINEVRSLRADPPAAHAIPSTFSHEEDSQITSNGPAMATPSSTHNSHPPDPPPLLPANLTASSRAANEHAFHLRVNLEPLEKYDGDRKNDAARFWSQQARRWLAKYERLQCAKASPQQALDLFTDALSSKAKDWWHGRLFATEQNWGHPAATSPDEFFAHLQEEFCELASDTKRREKYEALRQTGSVQDFYSKILDTIVYLDPKPSEFDMLRHFQLGLHIDVRVKMEMDYGHLITWQAYTTKADAVDRGQQLERQLRRKAGGSGETRFYQSTRTSRFDNRAPRPRHREATSELHAIFTKPDPRKDPIKFKAWCQSNAACFKCGDTTHQAKFHNEKRSNGRKSGN